ncbi:MAG: alpha/beta fold hydrolase [Pseudomonadota bacterium]
MATFVLLHGAWHGGWCWEKSATVLSGRGHRVTRPTLTGLGERAHLLTSSVGLDTFRQDIVNHLLAEDLSDVILVAHSFGGIVATLVVDEIAERFCRLVLLDSDLAIGGCSTFDLLAEDVVSSRLANLVDVRGVPCFPSPSGRTLGILDNGLARSTESRLTPHPVKSYQDIACLTRAQGAGLPGDYIICSKPNYGLSDTGAPKAQKLGFTIHELETGHDAMITEPFLLSDLLDQISSAA